MEVAFKGEQVTTKASGVRWKPGKCFTVRQRDAPTPPAAPARYRTSFFLLFEPCASGKARGLWDSHEKLSIVRVLRDEVVPRAVEIYKQDPENDGQDADGAGDEEDAVAEDDIGDDTTDEEEEDDHDDDESDSDEDESLQAKAEAAAKKRKGKAAADGMLKKVLERLDGPAPAVALALAALAPHLSPHSSHQ